MKAKRLFSEEDRKRVTNAIAAAEARTSGEIVPLVVDESDDYPHVALAGAVLGMLVALSAAVWLLPYPDYLQLFGVIVGGLVAGFLAGRYVPPVRRLLLGAKVAEVEVYQRALQAFHESGLVNTRDRTGVLIFVSLLERRVQVLADIGISEKAPDGMWDGVVGLVLEGIKSGDAAGGLVEAIERCGAVLAEHFPPRADDINELPDKLEIN